MPDRFPRNYGSLEKVYRHVCNECLNKEMAEAAGLEGFENGKFQMDG